MVVIGVAVVLVHEILAEDMVGQRMALFLVVIVGHSRRAPRYIAAGRPAGRYRMLPMRSQDEPQNWYFPRPLWGRAGRVVVVAAQGVAGKPPPATPPYKGGEKSPSSQRVCALNRIMARPGPPAFEARPCSWLH